MIKAQDSHGEVAPMLLHTRDAARMITVSDRTLEDWRLQGRGPKFIKFGRMVRYRLADVMAFIDGPSFQNTGEAA